MDLSSETELVNQLKQGDSAAFKQLVETYQDQVYNTCLGFLRHPDDAEDMAQEVFVEVHRSIGGFRLESRLSTWIYRIAVSKSLELIRKHKRRKRFASVLAVFKSDPPARNEDEYIHPGIILENKEQARVLYAAIERLPQNQRIAFTLHKIEGLSYQQISEVMENTLPAVESLMHRARGNLRTYLRAYHEEIKR